MDVEHGDAYRDPCDFCVAGRGDGTFDQGNVCGSASHIKGDDAGESAATGAGSGADDATGGAGENGAHGLAGSGSECRDAAAGLHNENSVALSYLRGLNPQGFWI